MTKFSIRDFDDADALALNLVALAAFSEFKDNYSDWSAMADGVSQMSHLATQGEVFVAVMNQAIVGGVAYLPSGRPKADFFEQSWAVIRMLVVDPGARGHGIGRRLTEQCISCARRDNAPLIALHTSSIMSVAQPMYMRMGFDLVREAPAIYGVPYAIYTKPL